MIKTKPPSRNHGCASCSPTSDHGEPFDAERDGQPRAVESQCQRDGHRTKGYGQRMQAPLPVADPQHPRDGQREGRQSADGERRHGQRHVFESEIDQSDQGVAVQMLQQVVGVAQPPIESEDDVELRHRVQREHRDRRDEIRQRATGSLVGVEPGDKGQDDERPTPPTAVPSTDAHGDRDGDDRCGNEVDPERDAMAVKNHDRAGVIEKRPKAEHDRDGVAPAMPHVRAQDCRGTGRRRASGNLRSAAIWRSCSTCRCPPGDREPREQEAQRVQDRPVVSAAPGTGCRTRGARRK